VTFEKNYCARWGASDFGQMAGVLDATNEMSIIFEKVTGSDVTKAVSRSEADG
jgi:hypothetical protein